MQKIVFEIPLSMTQSDFPTALLKRAQILYMLKFDSKGYLFVCRMPTEDWQEYREKSFSRLEPSRISIKVLMKEKSGNTLLQVSGRWIENGKLDLVKSRQFDFFRSMERASIYGMEIPTIYGNAIRFTLAADAARIRRLLSGLKEFDIPYKVNKLERLGANFDRSVLNDLTLQQTRVLRLAHTMGYYDIPRRTDTEDLARILEMDKATVGEHLRRAEKHVFDKLILEE